MCVVNGNLVDLIKLADELAYPCGLIKNIPEIGPLTAILVLSFED